MPSRRPAATTRPVVETRDLIEGLGKGLRVIEAFDEAHPQLTASMAAQRADITRTAARRYLLSLVHFGYAATDGKQFWLVPRVLRLGQSHLEAARFPRLVQPFIERTATQIGHTVAKHEFTTFTPQTVSSRAVFRTHVRQARALGYWHTESQLDPGLRGASVALLDRKGRCAGAIGTTMPTTAYRDAQRMLDAVLPALQEAAQALRTVL